MTELATQRMPLQSQPRNLPMKPTLVVVCVLFTSCSETPAAINDCDDVLNNFSRTFTSTSSINRLKSRVREARLICSLAKKAGWCLDLETHDTSASATCSDVQLLDNGEKGLVPRGCLGDYINYCIGQAL